VAHREAELAKAQTDLKKLRVSADQKQLQLKAGEDKIKDLQRKLNTATSNREYQTLKDQIAATTWPTAYCRRNPRSPRGVDQAQTRSKSWKPRWWSPQEGRNGPRRSAEAGAHVAGRHRPPGGRVAAGRVGAAADDPRRLSARGPLARRRRAGDGRNEFCGGCNQHVPLNVCAEILMGTHVLPQLRAIVVRAGGQGAAAAGAEE